MLQLERHAGRIRHGHPVLRPSHAASLLPTPRGPPDSSRRVPPGAADLATFLGRKLHGNYQDEMGNKLNKCWLGTRLKHQMGPVTLKLYDKFNLILRIETTVNDLTFFGQHRQVQHRDGTVTTKWAPMKKSIYSLSPLQETLAAVNHRYLKFLLALELSVLGVKNSTN